MDITEAAKIWDVKEDEIKQYEEICDTFNNNIISLFLCKRADNRYGSLIIYKVNDQECKQVIYCTPKLDYPFDLSGKYHFPDCHILKFYEKLDGTNIFSYHYTYENNEFITFKTRLTPILKDQKFGLFKTMWEEYLNENNWVNEVIELNPSFNLSFELFGSRNPITIEHIVPLDINLLFGVRRFDYVIVPPSSLKLTKHSKIPKEYSLTSKDDLIDLYNNFRKIMSEKNKDKLIIEGLVQYCNIGQPSWKLFKCKPEEIEKIHWTASGHIPYLSLINTALNVFESDDEPTIENFIELLKEEYPSDLITKSFHKIEKCWKEAIDKIKFTKLVNEIWIEAKKSGLDITKNKNETLRFMSKYFSKNKMGKVGTVVLKTAGLLKDKEMRQHKK